MSIDTPSLFDQLEDPGRRRARITDPDTSQDAADMLDVRKPCARVLISVHMHTGNAIRDQIATDLSMEPSCVSSRFNDLERMGYLTRTDRRRPGYSKRQQIVFEITDAGRAMVAELRR